MKRYLIILAIIASCSNKKGTTIRKIPCENIFTYNNTGSLDGTYLTSYYAVDYSDSMPVKDIRNVLDSSINRINTKKYSGGVFWFLKESTELQKIKNCETTDSHNLGSNEHKAVALFLYDAQKKSVEEISYDKDGNFSSNFLRR